MRAAPDAQRRLLDLARVDAARARLQHTANTLPEQQHLGKLEGERSERRAEVAHLTGVVEGSEAELTRMQSDVELVEARMERDRQRMATSSSAKDLQGLEHELATLQKRRSDLEDIELEIMERLDAERAQLAEATAQRDRIESEAAELAVLRDKAIESLKQEAKVLAGERRSLLAELPAELVELYESRRMRGVGAAELVGNVTMATGVELDHADLVRIAAAAPDEVVMCPDSGAILVRTERSSKG
ncbi:putative protein [Pseudoclavibacter triregionum]|nr:putative protein [Pseudoclavibacter triregionum]